MALWIASPLACMADDAGGGIVVDGKFIVELVAAGKTPVSPITETFDASAHVVIPGLINTHHHFFQTLTRAFPPALDKTLFDWLIALYPVWRGLTPEALASAATCALAELMLSGCTTTSDHHYVFPAGLEHAIDIEIEAAGSLGMRFIATRGSMNASGRDGGLPPEQIVQDEDTIVADSQRLLATHHDPAPGAMTQVALAPCSPFSVSIDLMRETARLAEAHDARLHTHLAETRDEDDYCHKLFACRPLEYLDRCGWLGERTWIAHGIHFRDDEIARLGEAGVAVSHCPTSNMTLASGHCRVCELEAAGAVVGLGVDGSASNDASNMMEAVRHAFLVNRQRYGVGAVTHRDALRWATLGSARCLGRTDIGEIAVGKCADLALYRLDDIRFSGAHDPLAALVLCGAGRADRVMIDGRWRVVDGAIAGLDMSQLMAQHSTHAANLARTMT